MHRATFDPVWLSVLILTPGVGVPAGPVCPAFPLRFRLGLSAGRGGARVAWNSWDQACSHGQCCGRCIRRRRAERASRAGMFDQLGADGAGDGFGAEGRGQAAGGAGEVERDRGQRYRLGGIRREEEGVANGERGDALLRPYLAITLVALSVLGVVLAAMVAILSATNEGRPEMARLVFVSVLPLFGTWVGTVLAFYFARDNLRAATDSTLRLQQGIEPGTPVNEAMVPRGKIISFNVPAGGDVSTVKLSDLTAKLQREGVQRIPIFDASGKVLYVVHDACIAMFPGVDGKDSSAWTIGDLLRDPQSSAFIQAIGIVGPRAIVADARAAMRSIPSCNDVFVTSSGRRDDPVVGWLTNTLLAGVD